MSETRAESPKPQDIENDVEVSMCIIEKNAWQKIMCLTAIAQNIDTEHTDRWVDFFFIKFIAEWECGVLKFFHTSVLYVCLCACVNNFVVCVWFAYYTTNTFFYEIVTRNQADRLAFKKKKKMLNITGI